MKKFPSFMVSLVLSFAAFGSVSAYASEFVCRGFPNDHSSFSLQVTDGRVAVQYKEYRHDVFYRFGEKLKAAHFNLFVKDSGQQHYQSRGVLKHSYTDSDAAYRTDEVGNLYIDFRGNEITVSEDGSEVFWNGKSLRNVECASAVGKEG